MDCGPGGLSVIQKFYLSNVLPGRYYYRRDIKLVMEERRKQKRYPIKTPAEAITDIGSIPVVVTEISTGGLKLHTSKSIVPKTPVDIVINIGRQITFGGQIVWVIQRYDRMGVYYHTGMDTDFISDQGDEVLYFRRLENLVQEIVARTKPRRASRYCLIPSSEQLESRPL